MTILTRQLCQYEIPQDNAEIKSLQSHFSFNEINPEEILFKEKEELEEMYKIKKEKGNAIISFKTLQGEIA